MLDKKTVRETHLELRKNISKEDCALLSKKIESQFFSSIDLSSVKALHTFLPIVSKNEPDTWLIIEKLQTEFPQIRISIPKVDSSHLLNFYFDGQVELKKNQWNILEPVNGEQTPISTIDLVLVPLLAFDTKGNRVGYGKGFYDRFLSECKASCIKIGLSFFGPTEQLIRVDPFDVQLNVVITPAQVFQF